MNPGELSQVIVTLLVYFFPAMVAAIRGHHQTVAIFALNAMLGWTVIGWAIALIWALTAKRTNRINQTAN